MKGFFFNGKTARAVSAEFLVHGTRVRVQTLDGETLMPVCDLAVCDIIPPLGRTRRIIQLPRGQRFETDDLESVREIEADTGLNKTFSLIHFSPPSTVSYYLVQQPLTDRLMGGN